MTDGRKYRPAHLAEPVPLRTRAGAYLGAVIGPRTTTVAGATAGSRRAGRVAVPALATLALTAGGVLAAPAHAEDLDARIDRVQGDVDRLAAASDDAAAQRDRAQRRTGDSRERVAGLERDLQAQQQRLAALRLQLAEGVLADAGTVLDRELPVSRSEDRQAPGAAAAATDAVADPAAAQAAEELLTSVALVTEDTGGAAAQIVAAEQQVEQLARTQDQVRERLRERRTALQAADAAAAEAQARVERRQDRLDELEAKQAEEVSRSAVDYAMAQVGKSYVWGASGPSSFDCSGLTMAAWATEGVSLPHSSSAQYSSGTRVSESELQPGDLVFYYSPISHVGIYVGGGKIVNALNPGSGVRISGLHDMPYVGAVRPG